ncbi:acyltransferase family protein [Microvirga arabica]|uniref:acyltransferase family protein n=1 Tax=Microvirga arabica TaxID=1128671 RepID=UPI00193AC8DA|nr:acyltransferase family protein [Microvirga arabica]MBM1175542.1 acyltransferase family protein [Microvirga arabica]
MFLPISGIDRATPASSEKRYSQTEQGSGDRLVWMDTLRGSAILLVILLHASLMTELFDKAPWEPLVHLNRLFSPYRMALLMLLSGMLLAHSLCRPLLEYTLRKVATLLYPYLIWTAAYGFIVHPAGVTAPILWIGGTYLWFILFLFSYYMIAVLVARIPTSIILVLSFSLSLISPDGTKYMENYLYLMGFFFLGHYLSSRQMILSNFTSPRALIWAVPISIGFSLVSVATGGINYKVEYLIPALAGTIVLIALAQRISRTGWSEELNFIGRNSVVFFVIHYPAIYIFMALFLWLGMDSAMALTGSAFAGSMCICWTAAQLRERLAFSEYLYSFPIKGILSSMERVGLFLRTERH